MQCRRCGFENMPGLTSCMRCSSLLVAAEPIQVHPPRAGWTFHFRPVLYRLNRLWQGLPADVGGRLDRALSHSLLDLQNFLWALLSIVPGLGHLASGRFRSIRGLLGAWAVAMAVGASFFGTWYGSLAFGLAIGFHSWIFIDAMRGRELWSTARGRMAAVLIVYACFALALYGGIQRAIFSGAYPRAAIPSHGIQPDDFVLFWRWGPVQRGDIVRYHVYGTGPQLPFETYTIRGGDVVGRILALPGERVGIGGGTISITEKNGQTVQYAVPGLELLFAVPPGGESPPSPFEMVVPAGQYLCFPARLEMVNNMITPRQVLDHIGLPKREDFRGRAFMIYDRFFMGERIPRLPLDPVKPAQP